MCRCLVAEVASRICSLPGILDPTSTKYIACHYNQTYLACHAINLFLLLFPTDGNEGVWCIFLNTLLRTAWKNFSKSQRTKKITSLEKLCKKPLCKTQRVSRLRSYVWGLFHSWENQSMSMKYWGLRGSYEQYTILKTHIKANHGKT